MPENFLTVPDVAARLAIAPRTVRELIARHAFPTYKVGGSRRIRPSDLESWLESNREERAA